VYPVTEKVVGLLLYHCLLVLTYSSLLGKAFDLLLYFRRIRIVLRLRMVWLRCSKPFELAYVLWWQLMKCGV